MMEHVKIEKNIFIRFVIEKIKSRYILKFLGITEEEFYKLSLDQTEEKVSNRYNTMTEEDWADFWNETYKY